MANKQKLLESAQKNIKKKQLPRAIKDLQKVVEIDPRDIRSRQRLAELYVKTNKTGEAFEQYEAVAKYFASNGFYLKAIAIYKQMQRLDPSQISIFSRLAELNEKQGLTGNALAELRHLVGYYEKNDMVADAIKTLEKMRDLDPNNINVQVKLTEVYANNDRIDDGLSEFKAILKTLGDKQDFDKILRLYRMFMPLFPQSDELQKGLALTLFEKGELAKGITILKTLLRDNSADVEILSLLATAYERQEDNKNARLTYQHLLKLEPQDLETREHLVQCFLNDDDYDKALVELEDWKESFLKVNRLERLQELYETLREKMPGNQTVLRTLDSIYEITGEGDKLLDMVAGGREETETVSEDYGEETLSDSLLSSLDEDEDLLTLDEGDLLVSPASEDEGEETALELELVEEEGEGEDEEFIELNLGDSSAGDSDELSLDFDLEEEDEAPRRDISADLEEAEFYLQQGLFDEAEKVCIGILEYSPQNQEVEAKLEEIKKLRDAQGSQADSSSELQDLAAELLEDGFPELDLEEVEDAGTGQIGAIDDYPEAVADADLSSGDQKKVFRTDVDEQIASDDMESHYNLGIAYREMGLFDDAVAEFSKAKKDPARFADCQTLIGLCHVDKGDFEQGEKSFLAALDGESLEEGQRLSLYYELGVLYENWERPLDALESFTMVADSDLSFRDVGERLALLRKTLDMPEEGAGPSEEPPIENKDRISFL